MFLTIPRHEILAFTGTEISYSGKCFYDLCVYRDREEKNISTLFHRITCELGFLSLALLSLIEAIVRIPLTCIAVIFFSNRIDWMKCLHNAVITVLFSISACVYNLFFKTITNSVVDLDCALRSHFVDYLLLESCANGQVSLTKKLLKEEKADPHRIFENSGITAALATHTNGFPKLQKLFALNEYETGFCTFKRLGHWLGLEGKVEIDGHAFTLEGAQSHWFFESLAESFQRFRTWSDFGYLSLTQEKAESLQEALYQAYVEHSYENIASRIRSGKLTFIGSGWQRHAICLVVYGKYFAVCNTGNPDTPTIDVFKIDCKKMTPAIVEEIFMHTHLGRKTGETYFFDTLPTKLSKKNALKKDSVCEAFQTITPKHQKTGNCALASKKAAIRFAWAMLLGNPPTKETLARATFETKFFTDWVATHYLKDSNLYEKYPHLHEIIDHAFLRGVKKINRYKRLSRLIRIPFSRFLN